MKEKYIKIKNLYISGKLLNFVNNELLPGTKIKKEVFWNGFDKYVHELAPKNNKLLEIREKLQKKIDDWYKDRKGEKINIKKYAKFLIKIGYLKKSGPDFKIKTKNVDNEISNICGPQLVVPISNARYALNAANARWVSLYDSLYGTDVIPETEEALRGKTYNPIRGKKVIEYVRNLLDKYVPLKEESWKDLSKIPEVKKNKLNL
ncbi:malate synthase G, partial [Marine Group I thaumarchaeote]|nr:malate synthase G [Marine Group I thaumarchaeote]